MYSAYQISKLNERRAVTSPLMRCDVTRLGLELTRENKVRENKVRVGISTSWQKYELTSTQLCVVNYGSIEDSDQIGRIRVLAVRSMGNK